MTRPKTGLRGTLMRYIMALCLILFTATTLGAAPRTYALDPAQSLVGFAWDFGPDEIKGEMPVTRADLSLDFKDVTKSKVAVDVDVTRAKAGFPFASQGMKGPKVLDAANHPTISFVSSSVQRTKDGARINGDITVRGVTRPMSFDAQIFRQRGTEETDLSQLVILLNGALNRSEFGANGWSDLAGDQVRLNIRAYIEETN